MRYRINYGETELPINIKKIEQKYNAKYIGDFCLKTRDGSWSESPAAIFWQEKPPVEGYSNYFGLFVRDDRLFITSGESAFETPIEGIVSADGEVVYSRYRWDMRGLSDDSGYIDGGRDYVKISAGKNGEFPKTVLLKINGPQLEVIEMCEQFVAEVQYDDETGEQFIVLPDEILTEVGWVVNDTIIWTDNKDGSFTLRRKEDA